jgi:hypothetical protein
MAHDIDGRADQYALAGTAFQLFTGAPPYESSNPVAVISARGDGGTIELSSISATSVQGSRELTNQSRCSRLSAKT